MEKKLNNFRQIFRQSVAKYICPFSDSTWSPADDVISAFQSKSMQSFYELFFFFYNQR